MASIRQHSRIRLVAVVVAACLLVAPSAASAAAGTNGWYWPTGHNASSTGGGWLQHRNYSSGGEAWHLAWDDCGPVHEPVYSLGWGVVTFASMKVSGYGWDPVKRTTAPGGAIVIKYRTTDGAYFKALYGHLDFNEASMAVGTRVRPGQIIAVTTAYSTVPHVHFGIHLGENDPERTATSRDYVGILMGHTHDYTMRGTTKVPVTYGWTDPVRFLNTQRPWIAPPAVISTPTVPASVAAGRLFRATGTFAPAAPQGSRTITLRCERLEGSEYRLRATFRGTCYDATPDSSTWAVSARLPRPGTWRVRAYTPGDLGYSATYSGCATITVR